MWISFVFCDLLVLLQMVHKHNYCFFFVCLKTMWISFVFVSSLSTSKWLIHIIIVFFFFVCLKKVWISFVFVSSLSISRWSISISKKPRGLFPALLSKTGSICFVRKVFFSSEFGQTQVKIFLILKTIFCRQVSTVCIWVFSAIKCSTQSST